MIAEHSSKDVQQEVVDTPLELRPEIVAEQIDLIVCGQVVALAAMLKQHGG